MSVITSTAMGLPIPVVGGENGPQYAIDINNCLTLIDQHNHSPGSGDLVGSNGIGINAPLSFNGFPAKSVQAVNFSSQLFSLSSFTTEYVLGGELWYNDAAGNSVQITRGGVLNFTPSAIPGLVPPASLTYNSISDSFIFEQGVNTAAFLDAASIVLRNTSVSSFGLTLNPPPAMTANSSISLPLVPAVPSVVTIDSTGAMSTTPILTPTGACLPYAGAATPAGFLVCNGAAVSRATYATLFGTIGTTFGAGDGSTTFNVPNAINQLFFTSATNSPPAYAHSWWKMDASTFEPNAIQPTGFNLSVVGTVPSSPGKFIHARGPYTTSNYLFWPSGSSSSTVYDSLIFGASCWFNSSVSGTGQTLISKSSPLVGTGGWSLTLNGSNKIEAYIASTYLQSSAATYADGNWHYVVLANFGDGANNFRLYVDNVLQASTNGHNSWDTDTANLTVGGLSSTANQPFQGLIDDVVYFNSLPGLSTFEALISEIWNGGAGSQFNPSIAIEYIIKT